MDSIYPLLLVINLACHAGRTAYELFKKSGRVNLKSKSLFALIFVMMCSLWISWFTMCPLDPWPIHLSPSVRWTGLGIFVSGWILAMGALVQLKGLEDIDHLVTNGLFTKIRHPMYTGFMCWIVGWSIYHDAGVSLIAGFAGIANILFWRGLEDSSLEVHYGARYSEYRKRTWF